MQQDKVVAKNTPKDAMQEEFQVAAFYFVSI